MSSNMEFLVRQITVESSNKTWGTGSVVRGGSGGTGFTWTVAPLEGSVGWSSSEAIAVSLKVRKHLQALHLADCKSRDVPDPDNGEDSLKNYGEAINVLSKEGVSYSPTNENELKVGS